MSSSESFQSRVLAGRYRTLRPIGAGSQGTVDLAEDLLHGGRHVAVKQLEGLLGASDPEPAAERLRWFTHPRWAEILDEGRFAEHSRFQVTRYVEGKSLDKLTLPLPEAEVWRFLEDGARVLGAIHEQGVIHYDVTPGNFLREESAAGVAFTLTDGGLASLGAVKGIARGTPRFMAPELLEGAPHDHRADLYALGLVAFLLTAGRDPVVGGGGEVLGRRRREDAPPLRSVAPAASEALEKAIALLLARDPQARPADADAFLAKAHALRGTSPTSIPAADAASRASGGRIVGRDAEIARFREACRATMSRATVLVSSVPGGDTPPPPRPDPVLLVHGPAGSGGTRLLREFLALARAEDLAALALSGRGGAADRRSALRRLADSIAMLGGPGESAVLAPRRQNREQRPDVPPAGGSAVDARAIERFVDLCERVGQRAPFALLIEDFTELPAGTQEAVRVLSRHLLARAEHPDGRACPRVLLVVDLGSEECDALLIPDAEKPKQPCLPLAPLRPEDVRTLLGERFPGLDPSPKDLEAVHQASEGLPGVLVRLLAEGLRRGDLRRDTGRWLWVTDRISTYAVERTLSPQATAAFEALSPAARVAIDALALLDQPAPGPLLEALAGPDALRELHGSPLVAVSAEARPPRYALASHSARDAALAGMPSQAMASKRSDLIQALAAISVPDLTPEWTRLLCESGRNEEGLRVLLDFAEVVPTSARPRARGSLLRLLQQFTSALDSSTKRRQAAVLMGHGPEAANIAAAIAAAIPRPVPEEELPTAAECAENLAGGRQMVACESLCESVQTEAIAPKEGTDSVALGRLLVVRARCLLESKQGSQVREPVSKAIRLLRRRGAASREPARHAALARALFMSSRQRYEAGNRQGALCTGKRALRHSRLGRSPILTAYAYNNLAIVVESAGRIDKAEWATARALRLKRALGDIAATIGTLHNLARIRRQLGALHEAGFLLAQSISLGQRHAHREATALALLSAADLYDLQGNPQLAVDTLERARAMASADSSLAHGHVALARLCELQSALGRSTRAADMVKLSEQASPSAQGDEYRRLGLDHLRLNVYGAFEGSEPNDQRIPAHVLRRLVKDVAFPTAALAKVSAAGYRGLLAVSLRLLRGRRLNGLPTAIPTIREMVTLSGRARRVLVSLLLAGFGRLRTEQLPFDSAKHFARDLVAICKSQRWLGLLPRALASEARITFVLGDRIGGARILGACTAGYDACDYSGLPLRLTEADYLLSNLDPSSPAVSAADSVLRLHAIAHRLEQSASDSAANDRLASALKMILTFRAQMQAGAQLETVLEALNEQARQITRAERACIVVLGDSGEQEVRITSASGSAQPDLRLERVSQTVIRRAIAAREPVLLHDVYSDSELLARPSIAAMALRSVLCVPMLRGGDLVGVMYADSSAGAGNFDRIDLEILGLLAEQAGAAIETSRLVTVLQRSYADLKAAQERLIRGERLRVMGEMTSGVAHEFNNLLTAILARLQLLNLGYLSPEIRTHLELIEKAALDAAGVIRRLQSFSKDRRQQDYSQVDMADVCADVVELLRPLWSSRRRIGKRPISVHLRVERELTIMGDATELREVLTNLLKNSLEALEGGGSITVAATRRDSRVHIEVTDNGTGIPADQLLKVFDPFFTTKGERGTGLGLCLALQIVERHGGEIHLQSKVGSGTTAIVDLPYATRAGIRQDSSPKEPTPSVPVNVLVVDDDPDVLSPLCAYLEGSGHRVVGAASGTAAMQKVGEEAPDLIISDIGMPEMDGMEFCRRVHALRPHLPVILMSGTASAIEPSLVRDVGASALLAKPFTMRQVLDLLSSLTANSKPN